MGWDGNEERERGKCVVFFFLAVMRNHSPPLPWLQTNLDGAMGGEW